MQWLYPVELVTVAGSAVAAPGGTGYCCSLCDGPEDDKCSVSSSDYHKEAFKCMKDGKGDVAFVKIEMDSPKPFYDEANKTAYQYLCANGGRMGNVCITDILFEVW